MVNRYSGQYHAASPPAARMQDLVVDAKRSRLRVQVGNWELGVGFKRALDADDERDRRQRMRKQEDAGVVGTEVSEVAGGQLPVLAPEPDTAEVSA